MDSLVMRRPCLKDLPEMPPLPSGYLLRDRADGDLESLSSLLAAAFADDSWTPERVTRELLGDVNVKRTIVVEYGGLLVATSSVLLAPDDLPGTGVVHWVAADPGEKGKRLGYMVVLETLREFVRIGCTDALLRTDDARLAAIKTYLNLGFEPDLSPDGHRERWASVRKLLREKR